MTFISQGLPFLTREASDLGIASTRLRRSLVEHELRAVFDGVVVDAQVADSRELRLEAARLVLPPHAMVSDHSAAWIYGAETRPPGSMRDLRLNVVVPHSKNRISDSRVKVRQVVVPDHDVVEVRGLVLTSPLRTASDLMRLLFRPYALAAGDALVRAEVVAKEALLEYVSRLGPVPRVTQARQLTPVVDPLAETQGESWMRCRMLDTGLPIPVLNYTVTLHDGRERRLDAAYVEQRVASEYDGRTVHSTSVDREHDAARRSEVAEQLYWHFEVARYEHIFGTDATFEQALGEKLGIRVRPRTW